MLVKKHNLIVVGAGIAGLSTAYLYQIRFPDHNVLLLERDGPKHGRSCVGGGLTGRSGGHRMPGFQADHSEVVKLVGESAALELYEETIRISELTEKIIEQEAIACGSRRGYWIVDHCVDEFSKLDEFLAPRKALNLASPRLYTGADLKKIIDLNGYNAGLYFPDIASFDSPKFMYGLANAFIRRGGKILNGMEYAGHAKNAAPHSGKYRVRTSAGQSFFTDRLVLAGGDVLTRTIPSLHKRTFTIYTARVSVRLRPEDFRRISPRMTAQVGCDSDLKSGQNPLDGDFLWFTLHQDGFLKLGFGGCFAGVTPVSTENEVSAMMKEVLEEIHERVPFLDDGAYHIRTTVGGLNTSSNQLPHVGRLDGEEGVHVIAAQSGVGLNQSILLGGALVDSFSGNPRILDLLAQFSDNQIMIPTNPVLRRASLMIGARASSSNSFAAEKFGQVARMITKAVARDGDVTDAA